MSVRLEFTGSNLVCDVPVLAGFSVVFVGLSEEDAGAAEHGSADGGGAA